MWHLQICNKKYNVIKNTKCGVLLSMLQMWCTTIIAPHVLKNIVDNNVDELSNMA